MSWSIVCPACGRDGDFGWRLVSCGWHEELVCIQCGEWERDTRQAAVENATWSQLARLRTIWTRGAPPVSADPTAYGYVPPWAEPL